jgi:large subunit ribosomal protein L28
MLSGGGRPVFGRSRSEQVAAVCDLCGKGPGFGHNVPWSKKKTLRRWDPNIQRVHAVINGTPQRLHACTSCIKAGKVTR